MYVYIYIDALKDNCIHAMYTHVLFRQSLSANPGAATRTGLWWSSSQWRRTAPVKLASWQRSLLQATHQVALLRIPKKFAELIRIHTKGSI